MKQCEICNITFESGRSFSNHVRWNHKEVKYKKEKCVHCNKEIALCGLFNHIKSCLQNKKKCKKCGVEFNSRSNMFCTGTCAATFNNSVRVSCDRSYITPEWKRKQSVTTKENWQKGKFKIARQIYSSKNERDIVSWFKKTYPEDGWKSGGHLKLNEDESLSRDMWSDKLKICFEYDGIWHFKDIHGQLYKKQLKDKLLEQWCLENNYRLIRVDEKNYINVFQINELIYNKKDNVIKIGERY